jgi:hypothetical protein
MGYSIIQSKKYENELKNEVNMPDTPETPIVPDTDFIEIPNTPEDNTTPEIPEENNPEVPGDNVIDEEITDDNVVTDENDGEQGDEIVTDTPDDEIEVPVGDGYFNGEQL